MQLTTFITALGLASTALATNDCPNKLVGTWTLTSVNQTFPNGTTVFPYGDRPQGLLFQMPAPDLTWIEALNVRNGSNAQAPAQSNGGTYIIDSNGLFVNRTTLVSTIPTNIGLAENTTQFRLDPIGDDVLAETLFAPGGIVGHAIWTRFVPGSTSV